MFVVVSLRLVKTLVAKSVRVARERGVRATVIKVGGYIGYLADLARATGELRRQARKRPSVEEAVEFAFAFSSGRVEIRPFQIRSEIEMLLHRLASSPPGRLVEIGTAKGGTLFLLSRVATENARIASVDLPHGKFGGGYPLERIPLTRILARRGQTLKLFRADSHAQATLDAVSGWIGGPLDLLFIDGDHRYEGVRRDFEMYAPLVRAGGLIALHDIVPGPADWVGGVPRFWQEIKDSHRSWELVEDWGQSRFGIGLVQR